MKILVGIKHVPDTETKIKPVGDGPAIDETGVKWILSPYDEYALEQALLLREAGGGEVVVVTAGRAAAQASLRQALAMGADRAVLVEDERFERCDGVVRAKALAACARACEAELVLLGKYAVGTDEWQTGPMVAELLGWPHATAVCKLEFAAGTFTAQREVEGALEVQEGRLPAVLTCEKGLNEPRYASLKGIMQAKKKPLELQKAGDVGVTEDDLARPKLIWEALEPPPERGAGVMIDGEPAAQATELARRLREEAKVI